MRSQFGVPKAWFSCWVVVDENNRSVKMNSTQMKRWLEQKGATFKQGRGSHLKVYLNGRQSTLPMHGTTELGKGLEAAIKRQLGLK
jgi:mRNA interferase HicA